MAVVIEQKLILGVRRWNVKKSMVSIKAWCTSDARVCVTSHGIYLRQRGKGRGSSEVVGEPLYVQAVGKKNRHMLS
jgi:hypothetical protein